MKPLCLLAISAALISGLCSCKGGRERQAEIETARHYGHVSAIEFSQTIPLDTLTLETMLIDVSSRHATLLRHGSDAVARAYLDEFLATLDSVNPPLSDTLRRIVR